MGNIQIAQIQHHIEQSVLCWLATCSADGQPSVSPKEIFALYKDTSIIIANIASPGSRMNILQRGRACVSCIDIFTQKGIQIKGAARVIQSDDDEFDLMEHELTMLTGGAFPFNSVFQVMIEEVKEILAPRYRLFPNTSVEDQIKDALKTYGVSRKENC